MVIPSFAVGRTQEMLYFIREIKEKGLVKGHGNFPVYIDSPLAIEATRIFKDTDPDCFDADTRALLEKGIDPITFPGLRVTVTSDESRMINADRVPKVILSASGMCEAGRIRHHLKAQSVAAGVHHSVRGLSGGGHAGPHPAGRCHDGKTVR